MKKPLYFTLKFKSLVAFLLVFSLLFSLVFYLSAPKKEKAVSAEVSEKRVIIIDPGHGGEDGGTASSKGTLEKGLNLEISLKLNDLFRLLGYETVMTRTSDKMTYVGEHSTQRSKKISDVKERLKITEAYPNGILLSIHQNYFSESKYRGTQVFYSPQNELSRLFAEAIQLNIRKTLQPENERKIVKSTKDVYLLYNSKIPSVMVECGFMSNPGEALLLEEDDYQKQLAFSIAEGTINFLKT